MKLSEYLEEALKPSQYREYMKKWDNQFYKELFKRYEYETDKKFNRIYLPIKQLEGNTKPPEEIVDTLEKAGYNVADYAKGLAQNIQNPKRQIKIGKVLSKTPDILKKFVEDPRRKAKKNKYEIVISRHPYDIAGMSTGRGWTSCMNIDIGHYKKYVMDDVVVGTIIAYGIRTGKTPEEEREGKPAKANRDIKNPVCRVLIKPFISTVDNETIVLGVDGRVYGEEPEGFVETLLDWVNDVNDMDIHHDYTDTKHNPKLYRDTLFSPVYFKGDINDRDEDTIIKIVQSQPAYFRKINNPSKDIIKAAVLGNGMNYQYADLTYFNKKEINELQNSAVLSNPKAITLFMPDLDNIDKIMNLVDSNTEVMKYLAPKMEDDYIDELKEIFNQYYEIVQYLNHPPHEWLDKALEIDPWIYISIQNDYPDLQSAIVERDPDIFPHIIDSNSVSQEIAIQHNPEFIKYIKNPDNDIIIIAIKSALFNNLNLEEYLSDNKIYLDKLDSHYQKEILEELDYTLIAYFEEPSEELQILVMEYDPNLFEHINNPTEKIMILAVENDPENLDWIADRMMDKVPESIQLAAVNMDGLVISYIKEPSEKVKWAAIKNDGDAIGQIDDPSPEMQIAAIKQSAHCLVEMINNKQEVPEKIIAMALKEVPSLIRIIENPSKDLQLLAVHKDPAAFRGIKNPDPEVKAIYDKWVNKPISESALLEALKPRRISNG